MRNTIIQMKNSVEGLNSSKIDSVKPKKNHGRYVCRIYRGCSTESYTDGQYKKDIKRHGR